MGWKAYIDTTEGWMKNQIPIFLVRQNHDGSCDFVSEWAGNPVLYHEVSPFASKSSRDVQPQALKLDEDAARAVMEELQRYFGSYAGVDYERLRKDYDRVVAELAKATEHTRETMSTLLENRRAKGTST